MQRFNGQQRPDGDSGSPFLRAVSGYSSFNGQQRPDGDSGGDECVELADIALCFNGQQRPDGDSGTFETPSWIMPTLAFQWPAKAGWGFRDPQPSGSSSHREVSMASKGRMGIQAREWLVGKAKAHKFQWPAKAGWGFRRLFPAAVGFRQVSMASKGRMGIQGVV